MSTCGRIGTCSCVAADHANAARLIVITLLILVVLPSAEAGCTVQSLGMTSFIGKSTVGNWTVATNFTEPIASDLGIIGGGAVIGISALLSCLLWIIRVQCARRRNTPISESGIASSKMKANGSCGCCRKPSCCNSSRTRQTFHHHAYYIKTAGLFVHFWLDFISDIVNYAALVSAGPPCGCNELMSKLNPDANPMLGNGCEMGPVTFATTIRTSSQDCNWVEQFWQRNRWCFSSCDDLNICVFDDMRALPLFSRNFYLFLLPMFFYTMLAKEGLKVFVFCVMLLNKSTRTSPKLQYVARNLLTPFIAPFCGGAKLMRQLFDGTAVEPVKLLVVDFFLEDLPQFSITVMSLVLNRDQPPGPISVISLALSSSAIMMAALSLLTKCWSVVKEARTDLVLGGVVVQESTALSDCTFNPIHTNPAFDGCAPRIRAGDTTRRDPSCLENYTTQQTRWVPHAVHERLRELELTLPAITQRLTAIEAMLKTADFAQIEETHEVGKYRKGIKM